MKANSQFSIMPKSFWATIRTISQKVGYTVQKNGDRIVKVPSLDEIEKAFKALNLQTNTIVGQNKPTQLADDLISYFEYRADVLNNYVEPRLMDAALLKNKEGKELNADQKDVGLAKEVFNNIKAELKPTCPLPMNKQKGEKKAESYLTGIINMLVEANLNGLPCDYDPRGLTTVTRNDVPLRTLARRVDGAFPNVVNPTAIWEIKEYYYTTTFGSRVADGVYETLLDGIELEDLYKHEGIKVLHYLMIDSHFTWWDCGKSYLCRIIDMLNMGYVDEVLFGYEVVERLPDIVKDWVKLHGQYTSSHPEDLTSL